MLTKQSTKIELSVRSEFPGYDRGDSIESAYLNCALRAPMCPDGDRKPVDIVVVLDRSGSMAGKRLHLCKETIRFLMGELSAFDRLGLITYDSKIRTEFGLMKMDEIGKEKTEQTLKKINAGDRTNLSGGLMAGIQEVQKPTRSDEQEPNPVRSVLILTDGLANQGITKTSELVKLVQGMLEPNVSVFTFGYGSNHNVDMLRAISEVGSGVYYFVQNVDGVSIAFADCLGGLLSVVAQNINVEFFAMNGCKIKAIKTRKSKKVVVPHQHYTLELGDLYGEEERDVLIEMSMPSLPSENLESEVLKCRVSYINVLDSSLDQVEAFAVVRRPNELTASDRVPDSRITQQLNRILSLEALEIATIAAEGGDLSEGTEVLQRAMNQMTDKMKFLNDEDTIVSNALMDDLKECKGGLASQSMYKNRGKMRMKAKIQGHWNQRSNEAELNLDQIMKESDQSCSVPTSASSVSVSGYRNETKKRMLSKAIGFPSPNLPK